eukprot:CAMPEP_0119433976 /NCGR_PEP_ID=MMETSP1335-20130426/50433_1 /TAXON_ID=259385 /ORGANISM="Chrysoculter rhomboideus, Strain RCC1486" /LENGTH=202 /DNA_ID=CAMNT_0007459827 /DNA_START=251 /DNA_END=860 /DNA_ORIENTATION=-
MASWSSWKGPEPALILCAMAWHAQARISRGSVLDLIEPISKTWEEPPVRKTCSKRRHDERARGGGCQRDSERRAVCVKIHNAQHKRIRVDLQPAVLRTEASTAGCTSSRSHRGSSDVSARGTTEPPPTTRPPRGGATLDTALSSALHSAMPPSAHLPPTTRPPRGGATLDTALSSALHSAMPPSAHLRRANGSQRAGGSAHA